MALLEGDERFADGPTLAQAKERGERGGHVGKGPPRSQRRAHAAVQNHQRHFLPSVVRPAPRRVVSVIGGENDEVFVVAARKEFREPAVELHQRAQVTRRVAAMSEKRVKIDEVGEDKAVFFIRPQPVDGRHTFRIRPGGRGVRDAAAGEDVADFSHAFHAKPGLGDGVEDGARRGHGEIMPSGRALEGAGRAGERTRDHAPDAPRVRMPPGDAADFIEPLAGEDALVRGDLQD
jgi:hypothetical protein